jgi:membrane protein DedA with SNARE-associated domain
LLVDLVENITEFLESIVLTLGPLGIVLVSFLENLFPPTPSEVLYPLAGKLAADGLLSPLTIIVAGTIGSLSGALLWYTLGYRLGEERMRMLFVRFGQVRIGRVTISLITVTDYDRAIRLFKRRGGTILFLVRAMPLVHGIISIPAGIVRMNIGLFIVYFGLGSATWITPFVLLGYWLGHNWEQVLHVLDVYETIWYVLLALMGTLYLVYRARKAQVK